MADTFGTIHLAWSEAGEILHQFEGGFADDDKNISEMLLPSLPAWLNHQVSHLKPSLGLALCNQAMEFIEEGKHTLLPVNPALKGGRLAYVRDRYGVTLRWSPQASFFANLSSILEGTRQAVNNYIPYVFGFAEGASEVALKQAVSVVVSFYLGFLEELRRDARIGPQRDVWSPYFSNTLSCMTYDIIRVFDPDCENDLVYQDTISKMPAMILETKGRLAEASEWMGVLN